MESISVGLFDVWTILLNILYKEIFSVSDAIDDLWNFVEGKILMVHQKIISLALVSPKSMSVDSIRWANDHTQSF